MCTGSLFSDDLFKFSRHFFDLPINVCRDLMLKLHDIL